MKKILNGIGLVAIFRLIRDASSIKPLSDAFHLLNGSDEMFGYRWRQGINQKLADGYVPTKEGWKKRTDK